MRFDAAQDYITRLIHFLKESKMKFAKIKNNKEQLQIRSTSGPMNPKRPLETLETCNTKKVVQHAVENGWIDAASIANVTGHNLNNREGAINTVYVIEKKTAIDKQENVPIVKKKASKKAVLNEKTKK